MKSVQIENRTNEEKKNLFLLLVLFPFILKEKKANTTIEKKTLKNVFLKHEYAIDLIVPYNDVVIVIC